LEQHRFEEGQNIDFVLISILDKIRQYMDRILNEAIVIRLCPRVFNRDGVFTLSPCWYTVTNVRQHCAGKTVWRIAQAKEALTKRELG
jgi:hypothetical protein